MADEHLNYCVCTSYSDYVVVQNPYWGGHHALVWLVGFKMAGFMLSGTGIRMFVLGKWDYGIRVEWMEKRIAHAVLGEGEGAGCGGGQGWWCCVVYGM